MLNSICIKPMPMQVNARYYISMFSLQQSSRNSLQYPWSSLTIFWHSPVSKNMNSNNDNTLKTKLTAAPHHQLKQERSPQAPFLSS